MNFLLDVFRDLWYEKIEEVTTAVLTVQRSRVGGVYAPAQTQHHPACFKRLKRKFSQHKWREMMQNSNPCCQTRHVSKAKNKTSNLLWWRDSWKMVKIPRLQAGNKKIRNQVYKTCRQHAWNWLKMIEDVGHLGHIQPYRSLVQLRKPPVCHHAGLNFEPSFPITLARRSLGSAVIGSKHAPLLSAKWFTWRTIQLWRVKCQATSYHPTPVAPRKGMPTYLPTLLNKKQDIE